jgi:hypothetical protein
VADRLASYDVFLSYRVASEKTLAQALFSSLASAPQPR